MVSPLYNRANRLRRQALRIERFHDLWNKQRGRCHYCGCKMILRADLKLIPGDRIPYIAEMASEDHILPRSRKGPNTRENLCIACQHCNKKKSDRTDTEFRIDCRIWLSLRRALFDLDGNRIEPPGTEAES